MRVPALRAFGAAGPGDRVRLDTASSLNVLKWTWPGATPCPGSRRLPVAAPRPSYAPGLPAACRAYAPSRAGLRPGRSRKRSRVIGSGGGPGSVFHPGRSPAAVAAILHRKPLQGSGKPAPRPGRRPGRFSPSAPRRRHFPAALASLQRCTWSTALGKMRLARPRAPGLSWCWRSLRFRPAFPGVVSAIK